MDIQKHGQGEGRLCLQEGRAIAELLISLSLTLLLITILIHMQILIKQRMETLKIEQQLQAEAAGFFHYLESEMDDTNQVFISSGRIFFYSHGQRFDYRKSGNMIVREVNSSGHVEVCLYVKTFQARLAHHGIAIQLVLEKNKVVRQIETMVHYYVSGP